MRLHVHHARSLCWICSSPMWRSGLRAWAYLRCLRSPLTASWLSVAQVEGPMKQHYVLQVSANRLREAAMNSEQLVHGTALDGAKQPLSGSWLLAAGGVLGARPRTTPRRNRAASHDVAFSFQLAPHFAYAINAKVVVPHALDLKPNHYRASHELTVAQGLVARLVGVIRLGNTLQIGTPNRSLCSSMQLTITSVGRAPPVRKKPRPSSECWLGAALCFPAPES